jgi:aminopeptidase-like protein
MIKLLKKLYPLHRTLVSDDTDQAISIIKKSLPAGRSCVEEYEVGSKAWTWTIPSRFKVNKAILSDEDGKIYADFSKHPLYLWSYSISQNIKIRWSELDKHLYTSKVRPNAIPWYFRFYDKSWGFCVEYNKYKSMPRDKTYDVCIDVEFLQNPGLKVLTNFIDYGGKAELLICTNICHPYQVNDSITGVVCAVELNKRLKDRPVKDATLNINFLFCPETIGSIAYFANNENKIKLTKSAFFIEMLGHKDDDDFMLQFSRNKNDKINRIFEYVLTKNKKKYHTRNFARWNDEGTINGPGLNIPCPFLMKGTPSKDSRPYFNTNFYNEYHTSDDNPEIISEKKLTESVDIIEEVVRIYCSDYQPKQLDKGVIFLSGLDMHTSFYDNPDAGIFMDQIVYLLEGDMSVFEISLETGADFWNVKKFIDKLYSKGAIEKIIQ